jgi:hypothetical protein
MAETVGEASIRQTVCLRSSAEENLGLGLTGALLRGGAPVFFGGATLSEVLNYDPVYEVF